MRGSVQYCDKERGRLPFLEKKALRQKGDSSPQFLLPVRVSHTVAFHTLIPLRVTVLHTDLVAESDQSNDVVQKIPACSGFQPSLDFASGARRCENHWLLAIRPLGQ